MQDLVNGKSNSMNVEQVTDRAAQLLKQYFGYDTFRGMQADIIGHVMQDNDCLVLMPTGGGKSICYQLPALLKQGVTLVISPLISLMKDQVDALTANGISAAFMNSTLNYQQESDIVSRCISGGIKLLYMSPEKAQAGAEFLGRLPVSMIAIDEAHCVSQWGHDFRPEYKELGQLRKIFPRVPIMALTATADKITRTDILALLGLRNPEQFVSSFDRPNISLSVKGGLNKREKLRDIIGFITERANQCGIIYCTSRKSTENIAEELMNVGINARAYHGGMSNENRSEVQEAFINDDIQVVCATVAFGMGIDKSNVRYVLHYNLPRSVEGYYQEIGRGGRDGLACDTILYYTLGDLIMLQSFAKESGQPEINAEKLKRIREFAEAQHCRRRILLNYFGQQLTDNCGNCDVCRHPPVHSDGTAVAQKALSALTRIRKAGGEAGAHLLVDVLRGMKHAVIFERNLDTIKTYGAGADLSARQWNFYMLQMIQLGVFEVLYDKGNVLEVTSFGEQILKGQLKLYLNEPPDAEPKTVRKQERKAEPQSDLPHDQGLFENLRRLRKEIANAERLPPYIVFHDSTLYEMARQHPLTEAEMLRIAGISENKMEKYGQQFLDAIRTYAPGEIVPGMPASSDLLLSESNLIAYMEELHQKGLRFSPAVVGHILAGTAQETYIAIGSQVSFNKALAGVLSYKEISKRIKPFYKPYEDAVKEERKRTVTRTEEKQLEQRAIAEAYFTKVIRNTLSEEDWRDAEQVISAMPFKRAEETLSEPIRQLRKVYYRSHEPWSTEEIALLEKIIGNCNDLPRIVKLFGRSENSIVSMASRWMTS
jgi:ATP-dependent DNA helicase RecQ